MTLVATFQMISDNGLKHENEDRGGVPDDPVSDYLDEWE